MATASGYSVSGRVTVDVPDGSGSTKVGVEGALVDVEVDGLTPCTTVTSKGGNYVCRLAPDPSGSTAEFPLDVRVAITPPGGANPTAAAFAGAITESAVFGGSVPTAPTCS